MSCNQVQLTEHEKRKGPGWKHVFYKGRRRRKSRDRPFSGLPWSVEAEGAASRMAAREIVGDAEMLRVLREIEPNRAWTISMIRGKIFRIRHYVSIK